MTEPTAVSRPATILLANDQEWFARSLDSVLTATGYSVLRAHSGRQVLDLARTKRPDALIVHEHLVDLTGTELCRQIHEDRILSPTTAFLLTANAPFAHVQRIAALEAGAWDVFTHPIDADTMLFKLRTYLRAKREYDRAREDVYIDRLTGLYNRRGLVRRAEEIAAGALRTKRPAACVALAPMADLLGAPGELEEHSLVQIGQHLGAVCRRIGRSSDAIGRIGITEFAIMAPETTSDGAVRLAERYREAIGNTPVSVVGTDRTLSIRAGYASVEGAPNHTTDGEQLLSRAMIALRSTLEAGASGVFISAWDGRTMRED